jgi:RecJ-like exonuclease
MLEIKDFIAKCRACHSSGKIFVDASDAFWGSSGGYIACSSCNGTGKHKQKIIYMPTHRYYYQGYSNISCDQCSGTGKSKGASCKDCLGYGGFLELVPAQEGTWGYEPITIGTQRKYYTPYIFVKGLPKKNESLTYIKANLLA